MPEAAPAAQANKKSWYQDYCNYEKHLQPAFGRLPLDKITPFDIEKLTGSMKLGTSKLGRAYAPATIKQQLILLSHFYSLAAKWEMYEGPNPCRKVSKPKLNNQKTEHLADYQLKRLLAVLDSYRDKVAAGAVRFALYTGLRRGEIFNLTWDDIDKDWKTVKLRDPKGGRDVTLPLSDGALEILKRVPKRFNSPWIFHGRYGTQRKCIRAAWADIRKRAGLPSDFRFHGLRHHFASALVSDGVDLYTVQKLLTHKDAKTTQRYAHLADKTLREAVKRSEYLLNPDKKPEPESDPPEGISNAKNKKENGKEIRAKNRQHGGSLWGMVAKVFE